MFGKLKFDRVPTIEMFWNFSGVYRVPWTNPRKHTVAVSMLVILLCFPWNTYNGAKVGIAEDFEDTRLLKGGAHFGLAHLVRGSYSVSFRDQFRP